VFAFSANQSGSLTTTTTQCTGQDVIVFGWSASSTQLMVTNTTCSGNLVCAANNSCSGFSPGVVTYDYVLSNNDETLTLTDPTNPSTSLPFTRVQ
jgi:hypothetical protein